MVGCPECEAYWIVEIDTKRTRCRRCGTQWAVDGLRDHGTVSADDDDGVDALREKRSHLLAKQWDEPDAFADVAHYATLDDRLSDWPLLSDLYAAQVSDRPLLSDLYAAQVSDRPLLADMWAEPVADCHEFFKAAYQQSGRSHGTGSTGTQPRTEGDDTERLEALLRDPKSGDGAPIGWLARTLFRSAAGHGEKNWKWVRRQCDRWSWVDVTEIQDQQRQSDRDGNRTAASDLLWAFLDPTVLDTVSRHNRPRAGAESATDAKEKAEATISRRAKLETAEQWGDLIGSFGAKKRGYEALGGGDRTRFIDGGRARGGPSRIADAFSGAAAAGYDRGTVLSVTTDPERFDSIAAAADGLLDDAKNLRKKLGRHLESGMPASVTAPEPTRKGLPHGHIAIFGHEPADLPSKHELCRYWWETRERGQQLDLAPIALDDADASDEPRWYWRDDGPDDAGCPPCAYLSEGAESIVAAAWTDADDVKAIANAYRARGSAPITDGEPTAAAVGTSVTPSKIREAAWYWATDMKAATTGSQEIQP
ncbi:DUF5817 domain-containing protein [Natrinema sp. SYSU A 869]|uniref:DUF5817 domain-containing protein n=1 Tax=Natrinema sp. SYSU A 869 TaxID=2871694 RepID=UPI001CA4177D|nr:DUF5817 domain-containing protein [Natrinema sp. SYSU A 869]